MLKKRQDKITSDRETAEKNREDALAMKAEYEEKLKAANKEAELIFCLLYTSEIGLIKKWRQRDKKMESYFRRKGDV